MPDQIPRIAIKVIIVLIVNTLLTGCATPTSSNQQKCDVTNSEFTRIYRNLVNAGYQCDISPITSSACSNFIDRLGLTLKSGLYDAYTGCLRSRSITISSEQTDMLFEVDRMIKSASARHEANAP